MERLQFATIRRAGVVSLGLHRFLDELVRMRNVRSLSISKELSEIH